MASSPETVTFSERTQKAAAFLLACMQHDGADERIMRLPLSEIPTTVGATVKQLTKAIQRVAHAENPSEQLTLANPNLQGILQWIKENKSVDVKSDVKRHCLLAYLREDVKEMKLGGQLKSAKERNDVLVATFMVKHQFVVEAVCTKADTDAYFTRFKPRERKPTTTKKTAPPAGAAGAAPSGGAAAGASSSHRIGDDASTESEGEDDSAVSASSGDDEVSAKPAKATYAAAVLSAAAKATLTPQQKSAITRRLNKEKAAADAAAKAVKAGAH
jgi:hypothetical protein